MVFAFLVSTAFLFGQSDSSSVAGKPVRELTCHAPSLSADKLPLLIIVYNDHQYTNKNKSNNFFNSLHPQMLERVEIIKPDMGLSKFGDAAENGVIAVTIKEGFVLGTLGLVKWDNLSAE